MSSSHSLKSRLLCIGFIAFAIQFVLICASIGVKPSEPKDEGVAWTKWIDKDSESPVDVRFVPISESFRKESSENPSGYGHVYDLSGLVGKIVISAGNNAPESLIGADSHGLKLKVRLLPTLVPSYEIPWEQTDSANWIRPTSTNTSLERVYYKTATDTNSVLTATSPAEVPLTIYPELGYIAPRLDRPNGNGKINRSLVYVRYEIKTLDGTLLCRGMLDEVFRPHLSVRERIVVFIQRNINRPFNQDFIQRGRWKYLTNGLAATLSVALGAVILGAILGFLVAIVRTTYEKHNRLHVLNAICKIYLTVIRGTPMTVQLLIAFFIIFQSWTNATLVAIITFGFNSGAYVAEIIRAGITSIDDGQMEAGRSLGLSYAQGLRFIVLPQAVKNILPALGNEFIVLLKDTSIASFIALRDLSKGGEIIRSQTYDPYFPFLMVAAIYLVLVMFFTWALGKLEKRLNNE